MSHAVKKDFSFLEKEFLPFAKPQISQEAIDDVVECLKSGWLVTGPRVQHFEEMLKNYCQSPYVLTLGSATAGLFFVVQALDLGPDDEVITTPLTFVATTNAIASVGAKPIFVDIEEETLNINVNKIEASITEKTKAIMPVHFAGLPVDLDPLYALAEKYNLRVIEDAAHAIGAEYKGKKIGSFGDTQIFSFYANKTITTGEGGCITTRDPALAKEIGLLRFHGMDREAWNRYGKNGSQDYEIVKPGFKSNMMDLQAAIGIHQLKSLDLFIEQRQALVDEYQRLLAGWQEITLPQKPSYDHKHAWHLFTALINSDRCGMTRDEFMTALKNLNIGTGLHYKPVHLYPYYRETFGYKEGDFPIAESVGNRIISLPLFPAMTQIDLQRVIKAMKQVLRKN